MHTKELPLNKVQTAAYELIQSDATFLYTITDIFKNAHNINSNYICMSLPYIGLFADGAEQWCQKVGLNAPIFNETEKTFYSKLRLSNKLFSQTYDEYTQMLVNKLQESNAHFFAIQSFLEKIIGYYNVGTNLCLGEFCGNTILCSLYLPIDPFSSDEVGPFIKNMSTFAGKLAASFNVQNHPVYRYNDKLVVNYKDYHFYKKSPIKMNTNLGFVLFSILCSINYVIIFIDQYFKDEIPQKFKFAYLQYYYLCDFIKQISSQSNISLDINNCLYNKSFRNCMAHYGLGQYLTERDIIQGDILRGLTFKAFNTDYHSTKNTLYSILSDLTYQIKELIF